MCVYIITYFTYIMSTFLEPDEIVRGGGGLNPARGPRVGDPSPMKVINAYAILARVFFP